MAEFKILIEGYARKEGDIEVASCTTTLIKENNFNIIVDPGMNRNLLLKSLICDDSNTYTFDGKIKEHEGKIPKTNIEIIKTPGHDQFHCSVIMTTKDVGKVVIAGDVFWWGEDEKQKIDKENIMNHKDPYVKNEKQLNESRMKILEIANYIIPGHGNMFKVKK